MKTFADIFSTSRSYDSGKKTTYPAKPAGWTDEEWEAACTEHETARKVNQEMEAKRRAAAEIAEKRKREEDAKKAAEAEAAAAWKAKFANAQRSLENLAAFADEEPEFAKYFVDICKKVVERAGKSYAYFFEDEKGNLTEISKKSKSFADLERLGLIFRYEVDDKGKPIGDPIKD